MMATAPNLVEEYSGKLSTHLTGSSESVLFEAHELGRRAVTDGFGVLDLVNIHHHALSAAASHAGVDPGEAEFGMAAEFLAEFLSPFEMMLRGYREANARLTLANRELQQAKLAAEAANQELEAFSYSVAHDLRAPLRALSGFSTILQEDYAKKLDDEALHYLRYIQESAQQMSQLIDDLLSLSRVTYGEFKLETVDVSAIADGVAARLRTTQSPDRKVEFAIAGGLTAAADARLLTIALENLMGNAWKYSSKRAEAQIEVGAKMSNGACVYFVRDDGAGFDMAYVSKLFGVFQRLHSASEFEGTGIGLATVRRIIRRHGGQIWAEGKVGEGATFFFTLCGDPQLGQRTIQKA